MPTPEENKAAEAAAKEAAVIKGSPLDGDINAAPTEPVQTELNTEPPASPAEQPVVYSGVTGDLKSQEELVAYTRSLEKRDYESHLKRVETKEKETVEAPQLSKEETNIENLSWTEPAKAHKLNRELAKQEWREELNQEKKQKQSEDKFYEELYTENPDLKPMERIVKSVIVEKWSTIKELPPLEQKKFIAKESRIFASDVRKGMGVKETELPAGQVVMPGASGSVPPAKITEPQILSFSEQLKRQQAKNRVTG